jgi:drug/metabolite transporter (DMT)-like permease
MPPIWMTAARLSIGTLVTFAVLCYRHQLAWPKRQDWPFIISIGVLQMALFQLFFNYGMYYVQAGRAAILIYSTPLWVTPIAVAYFGEKLTVLKTFGLILGISGIVILFSPAEFNWHDPHVLIGNVLLLLGALSWAITILHIRYGQWHSEPIELLPWQLLLASIFPLLLAFLTEPVASIHWNASLIGILLFSGIVATAFCYWCSVVISKALPVITTSLSLLGVPVLTILLSAWLLAEPLTLDSSIAVVLIIVGLVCITLGNRSLPLSSEEK